MSIMKLLENGKWKMAYDKDPEEGIPLKKTNSTNRPVSKLNEEHKIFIQKFFDENKTAIIQDAVESLTENFEGLEIKKSRVSEFMKEDCNLTIKVVTRHPKRRNCSDTLDQRAQFVKEWTEKGILFMQNCVFIDESGFDINMRRSRGWSKRGTQAVIETPSARAVSHTIIGAITVYNVLNVSLRDTGNVKKRKVDGAKKRKATDAAVKAIPKGTTTGYYVQFISDTMDIMDEYDYMKGFHLVMDNAPIHSKTDINPIIIKRGYIIIDMK